MLASYCSDYCSFVVQSEVRKHDCASSIFLSKDSFYVCVGGGYLFIYFCACVYKNLSANAGDLSLIPGLRRSPGEGNGSQLQRFCLGNSIERGVLWATVPGVTKS